MWCLLGTVKVVCLGVVRDACGGRFEKKKKEKRSHIERKVRPSYII